MAVAAARKAGLLAQEAQAAVATDQIPVLPEVLEPLIPVAALVVVDIPLLQQHLALAAQAAPASSSSSTPYPFNLS